MKVKIISGVFVLSMMLGLSSAINAEDSPALNEEEELLFSCTEQILSIFAAITDASSCQAIDGDYDYVVQAANGQCNVTVENDLVVQGVVGAGSPNGSEILTNSVGEVELAGTNTDVRNLDGQFLFSPFGEIMLHNSEFQLKPGSRWEDYDEHVIKDYFAADVFSPPTPGVRDEGLEVITKLDAISQVRFPRAKWREVSEYQEPNGVQGKHEIMKHLVVVDPFFNDCDVMIPEATVIDFGGGLRAAGVIAVRD